MLIQNCYLAIPHTEDIICQLKHELPKLGLQPPHILKQPKGSQPLFECSYTTLRLQIILLAAKWKCTITPMWWTTVNWQETLEMNLTRLARKDREIPPKWIEDLHPNLKAKHK